MHGALSDATRARGGVARDTHSACITPPLHASSRTSAGIARYFGDLRAQRRGDADEGRFLKSIPHRPVCSLLRTELQAATAFRDALARRRAAI